MTDLTIEERLVRLEKFLPNFIDNPLELDSLKLSDDERRKRFGARIKARRKQIGLTQSAVARKLGIASQSVTNYESGKSDPSIRNLIALSAVLGTTTDWLLGETSR